MRQYLLERVLVTNVTLDHRQGLAGNLLDPLQRYRTAVGKIVENDD